MGSNHSNDSAKPNGESRLNKKESKSRLRPLTYGSHHSSTERVLKNSHCLQIWTFSWKNNQTSALLGSIRPSMGSHTCVGMVE